MPQCLQNNSRWPRRCNWPLGFILSGVILWISWENQFFLKCQWCFLIVGLQTQNFQNLFQMPQRLQNNSGWPRRCIWPVGFILSGVILWISWENQFFLKCQWCFLIVGLQTQNFQNLFQMPQHLQNNSGWPRRCIWPVGFILSGVILSISRENQFFLQVPVTFFDSWPANAKFSKSIPNATAPSKQLRMTP